MSQIDVVLRARKLLADESTSDELKRWAAEEIEEVVKDHYWTGPYHAPEWGQCHTCSFLRASGLPSYFDVEKAPFKFPWEKRRAG